MALTKTSNLGLYNALEFGDSSGTWQNILNSNAQNLEDRLTLTYAGDPNGNVAGYWKGQWCYDSTTSQLWFCTYATGSAISSTWVGLTETFDRIGNKAIYIPAAAWRPTKTSGCGPLEALEISAGQPELLGLPFDGTSIEYAQCSHVFPSSWANGSLQLRVHWYSSATDTDMVIWQIQAVAVEDGETFNVTFPTATVLNANAAQSSANLHYRTAKKTFTVKDLDVSDSGHIVFFQISRDPTNASDTHAEDAVLLGVELVYTTEDPSDTLT